MSQIWKYYHENERNRQQFLFNESIVRSFKLRSHVIDGVVSKQNESAISKGTPLENDAKFSLIFEDENAFLKTDTEKRVLHRIRTSSFSELVTKKVRFADDLGENNGQSKEADNLHTQHESHFEKFYTEFEESWRDLCQQYEQMRCNKKGVRVLQQEGDLASAISHFKNAGDAGCSRAHFNLGLLYETGSGFKRNMDLVSVLLTKLITCRIVFGNEKPVGLLQINSLILKFLSYFYCSQCNFIGSFL